MTTKKQTLREEITLPASVNAHLQDGALVLKGPKGEVSRSFAHPMVKVMVEGNKVILTSLKGTRRERTIVGSFAAHIQNSIKGVQEPHLYTLKICSGHFPMSVAVAGQEFVVKNFLGESVPRRVDLVKGVTVKIADKEITVTSPDREAAGLMAAKIESLCRITNRDLRIFMDGIWITSKCGKSI